MRLEVKSITKWKRKALQTATQLQEVLSELFQTTNYISHDASTVTTATKKMEKLVLALPLCPELYQTEKLICG